MKKLIILLLTALVSHVTIAQQHFNRVVVKANIPSLVMSTNGIGVEGNWDIGCGYHFTSHCSLFLDAAVCNTQTSRNHSVIIKKEIGVNPSFRLYLDSIHKVFLGIGTSLTIGNAEEVFNSPEEGVDRNQNYWRHTMNSYAGIDFYFRPKEKAFNYGLELVVQKNFLLWGNYFDWTGALDARGPVFSIALYTNF